MQVSHDEVVAVFHPDISSRFLVLLVIQTPQECRGQPSQSARMGEALPFQSGDVECATAIKRETALEDVGVGFYIPHIRLDN